MTFIKYSSEVKNAVIAEMSRYYILQGWGFNAAYLQVRQELQRDGKQMPSMHTVWKWIKPYKFRNLAESCKKTDSSDKLKFSPEVCKEMYEMLEHIEDVLDDSSGCGEISVEEIRKLLKKAIGEENE